jgi:hypothetical protein
MEPADPSQPPPPQRSPFDAFKELAGKLIRVPKAEIDRREAEYQKQQADKPKRGPKPS